MIYSSAKEYIDSQADIRAKIMAIDSIIDALLSTAATAAIDDNINEYWLNDGQTQIKTIYKGVQAIERSIQSFERLRQMYMNRIQGRTTILIDSKNFRGA